MVFELDICDLGFEFVELGLDFADCGAASNRILVVFDRMFMISGSHS